MGDLPKSLVLLGAVAKPFGQSVLSYSGQFDHFWTGWSWCPSDAGQKQLFVVWDDVPLLHKGQDIGLRNYMTFFDWAVKTTICAQREGTDVGAHTVPDIHVHVLQAVKQEEWPRSFGVTVQEALQPLLPWITMYSLSQSDVGRFLGALKSPNGPSSETLRGALRHGKLAQPAKLLQQLWVSDITKTETRHSIANALGPAILARQFEEAGYRSDVVTKWFGDRRRYFWDFLSCLELVPGAPQANSTNEKIPHSGDTRPDAIIAATTSGDGLASPRIEAAALGGLVRQNFVSDDNWGRFKKIRFALVDDQASYGFHDAIAPFLLGSDTKVALPKDRPLHSIRYSESSDSCFSLASFDNPHVLLDWLKQIERGRKDWSHPALYGKYPFYSKSHAGNYPQFDVLLLDLRLFSISRSRELTEEEKHFYGSLLDFFKKHEQAIGDSQRGIGPSRFEMIRQSADAANRLLTGPPDEGGDMKQLALLPLLISAVDPTLPIVIFSSSQQRSVLDLFASFPNIITDFSKPALTGYSRDDLASSEHAVSCLRRATKSAVVLHEKRLVWELLVDFDLSKAIAPPCKVLVDSGYDHKTDTSKKDSSYWNFAAFNALTLTRSRWFERRFDQIVLEFVLVDPIDVRQLYEPYEYLETSLSTSFREQEKCNENDTVSFFFSDVLFQQCNLSEGIRYKLVQHLKLARNKVVHGYLSDRTIDASAVRHCSTILLLKLLAAIANEDLANRLESLKDDAPLMAVVLGGKKMPPPGSGLTKTIRGILVECWGEESNPRYY